MALETTAFEVFRTSAQIEQLWGSAVTVYVRIWRWHRQDMIDVKAGRVCAAALFEYLIKTPHTKARWCQRCASVFCCLWTPLGSPVLSFSSFTSLHSPPSPVFCFFLYRFLSDQTQSAACMLRAGCYCSSQVRWNPRSVGLTSSALSSTLLEPNKDIFFPSLLICSHAFALSSPSNTRQPCHVANMLRTRPRNDFVPHCKCAIYKWKVKYFKKTPCNE